MMLIGLCGGSGSGKSTLIGMLKEEFPEQISVIDMDNYYISRDELPLEERRQVNYDVPESLDWEYMMNDIQKLKDGEIIEQPQFSFMTYERIDDTVKTMPAPILIVDGIFSLHNEALRNLYDLKVFVDVEPDVRLARRMIRNMERYGRTAEFEIEQNFGKVRPMHNKYVEPCKEYADLILSFYEKERLSLKPLIEVVKSRNAEIDRNSKELI